MDGVSCGVDVGFDGLVAGGEVQSQPIVTCVVDFDIDEADNFSR